MKKIIMIIGAVMFTAMTFAQVNFSGTWNINKEKSKLGEPSFAPKEIVIVQAENVLTLESHSEWDGQAMTTTDKYTLDGKECINKGMMDSQKKSVATWSEDKTSLKIVSKIPFQENEMTITEVFKLENGVLVYQSNASSSFGDFAETRVYDKKVSQ
jgi:hypothetical protein